jgi:hypothetical protein
LLPKYFTELYCNADEKYKQSVFLEITASPLFFFDRNEQRLEIAFAEAGLSMPLHHKI